MKPRVAVLVLGFKALKNIDDCFPNLLAQNYNNYEIWFADNNSGDGAAEYIEKNYPKVRVLKFEVNTGYAGGNNRLMEMAFGNGADFCLILNSDTRVKKDLITCLIKTFEAKKKAGIKVGLVQPVIMLFHQPKLINSAGNIIHYLGFGYCGSYKSTNVPKVDHEIISVSGTAMLISREYFEGIGKFDDDFFMYNEDQNYCWRGLLRGYKHYLSVKGTIWHKYLFSKNKSKWYHSEKNRLKMVMENYRSRTLIWLLPIILINECLILVYALTDGWLISKIKTYWYLLTNIELIKNKRKFIQKIRTVGDKPLVLRFGSELNFSEKNSILTRKIINPIYRLYYNLIVKLI